MENSNSRYKFRAWNTHKNQMSPVSQITFPGGGGHYVEKGLGISIDYQPHYILMQFTGLHDSTKWEQLTETEQKKWLESHTQEEWNGKEIYESDLFELVYADCPNGFKFLGKETTYTHVYGSVVNKFGGWKIKHVHPESKETVYVDLYSILKDNPKPIVGNIYEDSHLLVQKEQ
jgi:hypothetical protein